MPSSSATRRSTLVTRLAISFAAFAALATAAPITDLTTPASLLVPTPDVDPFYVPPATFAKDHPGTVYRHRAALNTGMVGVNGTQLLFRTTNALGQPTVTVTTILQSASSSKDYVVAYNMYEDAAAPQCAPSYCFNTLPTQGFCPGGDGMLMSFMQRGWTVIVTDFEGSVSGFSVGHMAGYQILDGYRATLNYFALPKTTILGGFGYSGGAIGTGWAAALQNAYAPELNVKALAFGGTPSNVTSTLLQVNGGAFAGFAVGGIAGQVASYPELYTRYKQIATAKGAQAILSAQSQCATADLASFATVNVLSTDFQSLGTGLLTDKIVSKYLGMNNMGSNKTETPTKPSIYMFHSTSDEVIPYASALKTAKTWCAYGAKIIFTTDVGGGGHVGTQVAYGELAFTWLDNALRGKTAPVTKCSFLTQSTPALPVRRV